MLTQIECVLQTATQKGGVMHMGLLATPAQDSPSLFSGAEEL